MVVIAVIAILCAILLPTIARAKAAAHSGACKSNLRNIGVALNAFVIENGQYPVLAQAAIKDGKLDMAAGPLMIGEVDYYPSYAAFLEFIPQGSGKILLCPARRPPANEIIRVDYGYNAIGAAWQDGKRLALGLGAAQVYSNAPASSMVVNFGQIQVARETMVVDPSDMIALADSADHIRAPYISVPGFIDPYVEEYNFFAPIGNRHSDGANVLFADGHVEYGKQNSWNELTPKAMARWNRDHQPHLKD